MAIGAGIFSYAGLRQDLYPEYDYPFVTVVTLFPSASPSTVEKDVTEPVEDAVEGLSGIKQTQSTSAANQSLVILEFEFDEDMEEAERNVQSRLNGLALPPGTSEPLVRRIGSEMVPVMQLSLTSDKDLVSLEQLIDDLIIPQIEQVVGVSRAENISELDRQVQVTADTEKLDDLGFSLFLVAEAMRRNNINIPAGDIDDQDQSFPVSTVHELGSLEDVRNLVIGHEGSVDSPPPALTEGVERSLRVRDIAEVEVSTSEASTIWRTDGNPSMVIHVFKKPDDDTVRVTSDVLSVIRRLEAEQPGLTVLVMKDDGADARNQLSGLARDGVIGFFLAVAVVFLFLINLRPSALRGIGLALRPTLIIAISIPLSLLVGIAILRVAGETLNFMTIAGLAIAVGRLVDDSIVVLENVYSHRQRGEEGLQAALDATKEVAAAIIGTTLTTIIAFLPLAFMIPGLVSTLFTPLIIALSGALAGSTLVALTVVPVLAAMLLKPNPENPDPTNRESSNDNWLQRIYTPALSWALRHRFATLFLTGLVTIASLGLAFIIPIRLFPSGSPDFLIIGVELPTGASVARTFDEIAAIEGVLEELKADGLVAHYQTSIGRAQDVFGFPGRKVSELNFASILVRLRERTEDDVVGQVRSMLGGAKDTVITVNGVRIDSPPELDLEINISGKDFSAMSVLANDLQREVQQVEGIINVDSDLTDFRNEVIIRSDPEELARLGLDTTSLGLQVQQYIVGRVIGQVDLEGDTVDLLIKGNPENRESVDQLKNLAIESPSGQIRLGSVSQIFLEPGPVSISRFDGERSITISGNIIAEDTQAVGWRIQSAIDSLDIPPGIEVKTLGIFQQIIESFQDITIAILVGVVLIYVFLVLSTRSLRNPLVILTSLPLAVVGGLVALALTGRTISLSSLMGILTLAGVVVDNAIVLIFFVDELRARGLSMQEALIQGGRSRVRPIVMTALTTTIALIPMATAFSTEGGSIIGAELATVVIGGLLSSTLLTLIVVPVMYMMFYDTAPRAGNAVISGTVACCTYCYGRCRAFFERYGASESGDGMGGEE